MPQWYQIMVEGVEEGFVQAVWVMFMGFYIHIEYPDDLKIKSTLGFVTKYILGIKDTTLKDKKVDKLWDKLVNCGN